MGGEVRIVLADGVAPNNNGIGAGPQMMNSLPGNRTGNPSAVAGGGCDFAIQGHGIFEDAKGLLVVHPMHKGLIENLAGSFFHPNHYVNASSSQAVNTSTRNPGIGVYHPHYDATHSSLEQGLGTGRCTAMVVTGFEVNVQSRASGLLPCSFEGKYLRVGLTGPRMKAFPHHLLGLNNHCPHHGIGCRLTSRPLG